MVKYHFPKPVEGDPVHEIVPPIRVSCDWPISGTFKPRLEGWAVAWSGVVTLVRVGDGRPKWVDTASVERVVDA